MVYSFETRHNLLESRMRKLNSRSITYKRGTNEVTLDATVYELDPDELLPFGISIDVRRIEPHFDQDVLDSIQVDIEDAPDLDTELFVVQWRGGLQHQMRIPLDQLGILTRRQDNGTSQIDLHPPHGTFRRSRSGRIAIVRGDMKWRADHKITTSIGIQVAQRGQGRPETVLRSMPLQTMVTPGRIFGQIVE